MIDIQGYEGLYAITSCGKVWSYRRQMFLKPYVEGGGYLKVSLCKDGKREQFKVHRLVAQAYIPNPLGLPQVNHINEIKTENHVNNLEWVTSKDNINHGTRNERVAKSLSKPIRCVELDRVFESQLQAAQELGINQGNLCSALNGRIKTCGNYHWEYAE